MKTLVIFVVMFIFASVSQTASAFPVQWTVEQGGNGHWYDVIHYRSTWSDAYAQALNLQGYLATLTSPAENQFVWSHFSYAGYWLGGYQTSYDNEPAGNWAWITGEQWSWSNWSHGQPDDHHPNTSVYDNEDRLQFDWWETGATGTWNDLPGPVLSGSVESNLAGTPTGGYIIEYDGNPSAVVPIANAGENLTTTSDKLATTILTGVATDEDEGDELQYRWLEGATVLLDWLPVGPAGECPLDLGGISLPIGAHTLTLEVTDGQATASDHMILTIGNSAPNAVASGGGSYEIGNDVTLSGQVSDFDGDTLSYSWKEGLDLLCSGTVESLAGGAAMNLPDDCIAASPGLGQHVFLLEVSDGVNPPVTSTTMVSIFDDTRPTLAPVADKTILWPADHAMVSVTIVANAEDNSGLPVTLAATVSSNEPQEGLGNGDLAPDWTTPVIDQENGVITLQLRAERSGSGGGREYVVRITATDASGLSSVADIRIIVPHDQGTGPVVTISALGDQVLESSRTGAVFRVSRNGDSAGALTVSYALGGRATNGKDYKKLKGTLAIPANATSADIALKPRNDRTLEGNETVEVSLIGNVAYSVGNPGAATITIVDDEQPPPIVTIEATDSTAAETPPDTGQFTISRTGSTQKALAVKCRILGTAKNGSDYQRLSRFTIPAGQSSLVVTVLPKDDTSAESDETVSLTISPNRAYQVGGAGAATVTISDND